MTKYARIKLTDSTKPFLLEITSESDRFLMGYEVAKDGERISPKGFDMRMRVVEKVTIKRQTPMVMNNHYGELEVAK